MTSLPTYLAAVRRLLAERAPETPWTDADIARYRDEGCSADEAAAELAFRELAAG